MIDSIHVRTHAMPATRVACPRCKTVLSSQAALPAGRLLKCGKCTGVFRVPQADLVTAAPTARTEPAGTRIVCPACRAAMRLPGVVPPNRPIRCAKCATIFRLGNRPGLLTRAAAKPAAQPARPTQLVSQKPTTLLTCAGCGASMRIHGAIRPGLAIPCPRCQKKLPLPTTKKTMLAPAKSNKTTQLVPNKARPTKLAPPKARQTRLAPKPSTRFRCPGCQATLSLPGPLPAGRSMKCPKCARLFRFRAKANTPPVNGKPGGVTAKSKPVAQTPPKWPWYAGGAVLLLAVAGAAFWFGKGFWSHDIPASEWVPFSPAGAHCRLAMPGEPREERRRTADVTIRKFTVKREDDTHGYTGVRTGSVSKAFWLEFTERSKANGFDNLYAATRDTLLRHANGQLLEERDIWLGSQRGKEFRIAPEEDGAMMGRFFVVGKRTYLLLAVGVNIEADAARFFESFRIDQ